MMLRRQRRALAIASLAWALLILGAPIPSVADECGCSPCDFDLDGDVDQDDFGRLQNCLSGFGVAQNDPACLSMRLDGDADVDSQDVAIFEACLSGANNLLAGTDLPPVIITEFMASNSSGLADEDGERPDWLELFVPCAASVDLTGWFLTDDPAEPAKWAFPSMTLTRGQYLVVFASGKDRHLADQQLHTNFQLDKAGEFLALVAPDGQTLVHSYHPVFPEQLQDVAYGLAQISREPVLARAAARFQVPTEAEAALGTDWTLPEYPDAGWASGTTGLGFSSVPTDFEVKLYRATVPVTSLSVAESVISDPTKRSSITTGRAALVNLRNTGASGRFGGDLAFPGMDQVGDVNDFVALITGTIVIPTTGEWTFGVNSSDGFGLRLTRSGTTLEFTYPDVREQADTLKTFNLTQAGTYALRLVYFERTGDASVELFATSGYVSVFDATRFRMVGDTANGGLVVGYLGADIVTDLGPAMKGINSSLWVRLPFTLDDPLPFVNVQLRMRYEDGFVAYLNGEVVAKRNAPSDLAWNSAATTNRSNSLAGNPENIDLSGFHALLRSGQNVLAIHGLNDTAADGDFVVLPELLIWTNDFQPQYLPAPTPGTANTSGSVGFIYPVEADVERGFHEAPFGLTLQTASPGATIRYTLNGSEPTETNGFVYSGPLWIDRTTILRASAFRSGYISPKPITHSYVFVNDVRLQSPQGQAPGAGWPIGSVNGQIIDYGMDPDIVNNPRWSSLVDDALLAIPSLSIVTDLKSLFDANTGIYTHATADGRAWERPTSLELLNPDGTQGFQIDCGIRIRGGYSRSGDNPKHAFRFFFRSEYGPSKLEFPLFESEGVDEFDHVDLRTAQNYCWSFNGDSRMTMCRDVFCRDLQGAMGQAYTRSRFYHLYVNGQYWGIYMTEERPEADFAASYFGGKAEDYDVIKVEAGPYTINATDGNTDAWFRLFQDMQAGFGSNANYFKARGLNPDGTPNPSYETLIDVDNLIDFNLVTYYGGDLDGPISAFIGGNSGVNNFYVSRDRTGAHGGFRSFKHDCEHTLLNVNEDRTGPYPAGQDFSRFNSQYLHQQLMNNAEYRMRFADRVQKHCFNGGVMTPQAATAQFLKRTGEIQLAIIAESARWGDSKVSTPFNRDDHWQAAVNTTVNSFFPNRTNVLINQFKAKGWFPTLAAPDFNHYGGSVPAGFQVAMSKPAGTSGTIYFTTDGSDPRMIGGGVSPTASVFNDGTSSQVLISSGEQWRFLDNGSNLGTAWRAVSYPSESTWKLGNTRIGWGNGETGSGLIPSGSTRNHTTYYFRKSFQVPAGLNVTGLTVEVLRDDGAAVYLNNGDPVSSNMPATWTFQTPANNCVGGFGETTFNALPLNPAALATGTNVVAAEVHQCAGSISDLSFDLRLTATVLNTEPIVVNDNMVVKARIRNGSDWSPLIEAVYLVGSVNVVINEFMAENATTFEDPEEPGEFPDWVELYNPGVVPVELGGMYLSDDPDEPTKFRIADGVSIGAGQHLLFIVDDDGTQGDLHTNFKLSKEGEHVILTDRDAVTVIDRIDFGLQTEDVAFGRSPDGAASLGLLESPTPGWANSALR